MKTYIFFTRRIDNIDGARQYICTKASYLEKRGWRVLVFSGMRRPIQIDGLKKYRKYIYPSLLYNPKGCGGKNSENQINKIIRDIGDYKKEQCIIESGYLPSSLWAEMVASRLGCRHLVFLLQETYRFDEDMKRFLRFKYDRHELAGIVKDSVCKIFDEESIVTRDDTYIKAYTNSVIGDCEDSFSKLLNNYADQTFAYLGRLNKFCVPSIIKAFCTYANLHLDKEFNIVVIGGSPYRGTEKAIRSTFKKCRNVTLIFTGNMYPIPINLIRNIDVFVSTAGSAVVTHLVRRPTILVHPETGNPVGVMGLDFKFGEKTMYDSVPGLSIEDCIDNAIMKHDEIEYSYFSETEYFSKMSTEFERQLSFVKKTTKDVYYDEKLLMKIRMPHLHYPVIQGLLEDVFGTKIHQFILSFIGKSM